MTLENRSRDQLIKELTSLRQRLARLEAMELDRREVEIALRESEAHYRSLFEDSPISIWEEDFSDVVAYLRDLKAGGVSDFHTYFNTYPEEILHCLRMVKVKSVNKATLELYGAKNRGAFLKGLDYFAGEAAEYAHRDSIIAIAEGKTSYERETTNRKLTGENLHIILKWTVAPGYEESYEKVFVSIIDISKRVKTEEALRESEERYSSMFHRSHAVMLLIDYDSGRILDANPSACSFYGYDREELLTLNVVEINVLPKDKVWEKMRGPSGGPFFFQHRLADGGIRDVEVYSVPIQVHGRKMRYSIIHDITERVHAERALQKAHQELEGRIRERTGDLVRANEALARSNRDLDDFASVASHDLQEPLRKILTFAERIKSKYEPALGEQGRDYLERMQSAAERMQTLIRALLNYSRVTTRAQPFSWVDLNQVAAQVTADLEMLAERTGGRIEVQHLPEIEADASQMEHLLQNLIGNSLKYHLPDVPPRVWVYSEVVETEPGVPERVRIMVEDEGIGFDEKYLDRVFAPFERLHRSDGYVGSGMGLAICRKIVERHGGTITARSEPGKGATFIATLPVRQT